MGTEEQAETGGVATANDTLTITDNRTGKTYEVPVEDGTIRATALRDIKVNESDFGVMSYDPAFMNTASCRSAITYLDGEAGDPGVPRLSDRAARRALHVPRGRLSPRTRGAAEREAARRVDERDHDRTRSCTRTSRASSRASATTRTRWGCCSRSVGALSTFYPDANQIKDPEIRYLQIVRLIAKMPTLAAFAYRHNMGQPYVYPDNDLRYPGNFLSMLFKMTELEVRARSSARAGAGHPVHPARRPRAELLDERGARRRLLAGRPVLGGRRAASRRSTARCTAAPTSRSCACCAGSSARRTSRTSSQGVKDGNGAPDGLRAPGLQELRPARHDHQEGLPTTSSRSRASTRCSRSRIELEKIALEDEYFVKRKLYPNVDFYSGLIYEALQHARRHVHRPVRDPAHERLDLPVARR